jgi:hypothetical protein
VISMAHVSWKRDVPEAIQSLDTLDRADYADVFTAQTAGAMRRSPEQWMRALLDDPSLSMRAVILGAVLVQRLVLGMPVGVQRTPESVHGWRIADRGDQWIRLEATSRLMTGHLILALSERQVSFATFVRYNTRRAAYIWPPVSRLHRQVGLFLMRHAMRTAQA